MAGSYVLAGVPGRDRAEHQVVLVHGFVLL